MTHQPLPLAEVSDESAYGGKAVGLGTALRGGLPVPPGVALPTGLVAVMGEDPHARDTVRALAPQMQGPLAVRSSAIGEDGATASFAGQHLTVLNVEEPDAVVDAVVRVAASASSASALAYRRARGNASPPLCGVVLQRLVPAEAAGVLFTVDPVTGADDLVVEASWALGEAVVEGLVIPDRFRLDRDGSVVEQSIGHKDRAIVPRAGGGTASVDVGPERSREPCLGPEELRALADLARRCDHVFGGPSDVEWACASGTVSLLQRRPITVLC